MLSFFAVATLLFFCFCECLEFCNLAKQRRKTFGGVSEVGKDDFSLYLFWLCVFFLVFYFSSAAIARPVAPLVKNAHIFYQCPHPSLGAWGTPTTCVGPHVSLGHGGGGGAHWGPPVLSSMTSERIQRSEKGGEAGSDPRGHLWVTWGVYVCAGKPTLADIILSHPPELN